MSQTPASIKRTFGQTAANWLIGQFEGVMMEFFWCTLFEVMNRFPTLDSLAVLLQNLHLAQKTMDVMQLGIDAFWFLNYLFVIGVFFMWRFREKFAWYQPKHQSAKGRTNY